MEVCRGRTRLVSFAESLKGGSAKLVTLIAIQIGRVALHLCLPVHPRGCGIEVGVSLDEYDNYHSLRFFLLLLVIEVRIYKA